MIARQEWRFGERLSFTPDLRQKITERIDRFDDIVLLLQIRFRGEIRISGRTGKIHQSRNAIKRFSQFIQIAVPEILILNFRQQCVFAQHGAPFEKLLSDFLNLLFRGFLNRTRRQKETHLFRLIRHIRKAAPFLIGQKRQLMFTNLLFSPFQHFPGTGLQGDRLDLLRRRIPLILFVKLGNPFFDLLTALRTAYQNLFRNSGNFKTSNLTFAIPFHFKLVTETAALAGKLILIGFPRITDRLEHLRWIECLERPVPLLRHIHDHVVRVKLRIKQPAVVMMILRIDELPGELEILRRIRFALADTDGRKTLQLPHPDLHRFPVRFDQMRIEQ